MNNCYTSIDSLYLQEMKITLRKTLYFLLILLVAGVVYNYKLIAYGYSQARGQFHILRNARPISEVMVDPDFPDSLKLKLQLVKEIKQFAFDTLGLRSSENYTTVYDQRGKEILWVVTACDPYQFNPLMWSFPLIGSFSYKGFFDYDKAIALAKSLKDQQYDVEMRSVSGWSTLGWFKDPILSNMLAEEEGALANTLIHELTHGTIFIPDSMTFNENLATFVGKNGALRFLEAKYGSESKEYSAYKNRLADSQLFTRHIVKSADVLNTIYKTMADEDDSTKQILKSSFIDDFVKSIDTIGFNDQERYLRYFENYRPNNAYFISFLNYRERQDELEILLIDTLDNRLSSFIEYWRTLYEN